MDDLNDLYYFTAVVKHKGFSAAARAIRVEKTRLSRRIAALEKRLGITLLQRSTRSVALTEAGERFFERCLAVVDDAHAAYDTLTQLKKEPSGRIYVRCPVVFAQTYLAPLLPRYLARHPKVSVHIETSEPMGNASEDRFDLEFRIRPQIDVTSGFVAKEVGRSRRILVARPSFLDRNGRPRAPADLHDYVTISTTEDMYGDEARWTLLDAEKNSVHIHHQPHLVSGDLRVLFEALTHGIGIGLLPENYITSALQENLIEQVLPEWTAAERIIHLVYPRPRGMLPSVRSLIDYLIFNIPTTIVERSV